jgi:hypothetical protein
VSELFDLVFPEHHFGQLGARLAAAATELGRRGNWARLAVGIRPALRVFQAVDEVANVVATAEVGEDRGEAVHRGGRWCFLPCRESNEVKRDEVCEGRKPLSNRDGTEVASTQVRKGARLRAFLRYQIRTSAWSRSSIYLNSRQVKTLKHVQGHHRNMPCACPANYCVHVTDNCEQSNIDTDYKPEKRQPPKHIFYDQGSLKNDPSPCA